MLDASSKTPSGLLSYNVGEMGHFEQCLSATSKFSYIKGKYCLGNIVVNSTSNSQDVHTFKFNELVKLNSIIVNTIIYALINQLQDYLKRLLERISPAIFMTGSPTWAICLPSNCSESDISTVLSSNSNLNKFELSSLTCQTEDEVNEPLRPEAIIAV